MSSIKAEAKVLVVSIVLLLAGTTFAVQPVLADSYNNVQVFVSTSTSHPYNFQFAAYNLTGSLIASYQSSYPAAAFELPSGGYLFTVSANQVYPYAQYPCPIEGSGVAKGAPGVAGPMMPSNGSGSAAVVPICYRPSSEYGFATNTISGPQTINIKLENVSQLPITPVTVKVSYVNGTAAADASVYGSIVGEWYYWWGQGSSITMGAQTDSNGIAHLVLPAAPAVITAWKWVPVFTGKNNSTIETDIGGQKVNVTVYWQPTYVGLSGSGLLLPPQDSVSLTLRYQQPNYWVMPMGVDVKGAYAGGPSTASVANQPNATPSLASSGQGTSQYYLPPQIPSIQQSSIQPSTSSPSGVFGFGSALTVAIIAVLVLAVGLVARGIYIRRPSARSG